MSLEIHIFLPSSALPSRDAWQSEIERLGFPTVLEQGFNPLVDRGFCPCLFKGKPGGFEFLYGKSSELLNVYPGLTEKIDRCDEVASFIWPSDSQDLGVSITASAALASLTGGFYFYPDDEIFLSASESIEQTRKDLAQLDSVSVSRPARSRSVVTKPSKPWWKLW
jgi:hypothetical protein